MFSCFITLKLQRYLDSFIQTTGLEIDLSRSKVSMKNTSCRPNNYSDVRSFHFLIYLRKRKSKIVKSTALFFTKATNQHIDGALLQSLCSINKNKRPTACLYYSPTSKWKEAENLQWSWSWVERGCFVGWAARCFSGWIQLHWCNVPALV